MKELPAKKSLGQHWLEDQAALRAICELARVGSGDTVLEIGPGLGSLTRHLVKRAKEVVAVELDPQLAVNLSDQVPAANLHVFEGDILQFDLNTLPVGYKVVANIPYYLTGKLLKMLAETANWPSSVTLLLQKEVAQRIVADPGQMSTLSVSVQLYYQVKLGQVIPAYLFTPQPKVDSQIIVLTRRGKPLFEDLNAKEFFRLVKAGFSGRRKKLRSSLSAGLQLEKKQADKLLQKARIEPNARAQELSLQQWYSLYQSYAR